MRLQLLPLCLMLRDFWLGHKVLPSNMNGSHHDRTNYHLRMKSTNIYSSDTHRVRSSNSRSSRKHERIYSAPDLRTQRSNQERQNVEHTLTMLGVEFKYIHRALKVFEKHYGQKYNIEIIIEIIYRLKVKDKLKHQKQSQNIFESKVNIENVLLSMDFSPHYIKRALSEYNAHLAVIISLHFLYMFCIFLRRFHYVSTHLFSKQVRAVIT